MVRTKKEVGVSVPAFDPSLPYSEGKRGQFIFLIQRGQAYSTKGVPMTDAEVDNAAGD